MRFLRTYVFVCLVVKLLIIINFRLPCFKTLIRYNFYCILISRDCRVVRSLDPCSKVPWFETTFRPVTKCEERISQLSVIASNKAKGITRYGHIERRDQGRTAQLVNEFSWLFVLSTETNTLRSKRTVFERYKTSV